MSWSYGDDYEYANSRISDTIVTHCGKPFRVYEVSPKLTAIGYYLDQSPDNLINVDCHEIDLTPVKLGYAWHDRLMHLSRVPARRYKQGLRNDSIHRILIGGAAGNPRSLPDKTLFQAIMGVYKPFQEVLDRAVAGASGDAWARHWALDGKCRIWYKGCDNVGTFSRDGQLKIKPEFKFLEEALKESL